MKTERLIIDQIKETDKEDYFINISHDKKVLETFICRYADSLEEFDFSSYPGRQDLFAIRLKETGRLIGIILYFDEKEDSCEIGYGIGSVFWNQGYATEAVGQFLEYLFREKGMRTVYASFFTGNDASHRVMEKCGMTFDHFSEKELTYLGALRDLTYYAIRRKYITLRDNSRHNFEPAVGQFKLCFPGDHTIITVPESPMFNAPEAAVVTVRRLTLIKQAGRQYAEKGEIEASLLAEITSPMIPEDQYAAIVNSGV